VKRLLLDQGLAPRAADLLRERGWNATHVSEIGMQCAEDFEILDLARETGQVCVTLDHDFHAHLAMTGVVHPSVVLLRVQGLDAHGQAELIRAVCERCEEALHDGAAVSADAKSIRVRRLPLS
jgi:predicted nuclease of predicted toxin-antitoxin system